MPAQLQRRDVGAGREKTEPNESMMVFTNGSLFLREVDSTDAGVYSCMRQNDVRDIRAKVNVVVRTPPPPPILSIKPHTVLAVLIYEMNGTGGYPVTYFTAEYRPAYNSSAKWIPISPNHIMPSSKQLELYSLIPNTTYEFRMWATNPLGRSPIVTAVATTRGQYSETGAGEFDTRWWAVAVGVVLGSLILLSIGVCTLLFQECRNPQPAEDEPEIIELLPNIILNPGFEGSQQRRRPSEDLSPDENSNNETPLRLNNNTVVYPQSHTL
ncbi:cell adhesion molecule DSCAM isoform X2 [Anthonomus grandis grandis]|uniref:cell adhesion molecule DSCAM isoform X2 n=1 Tax=Anthonomus grandis grandis TaxID=2921223 RepID=UPI0021666034|nr:cell adhesion molecule DSCAM isoform X2 [Anthonomus grandis grandis]